MNLVEARKNAELPRAKAADLIGVSLATLARWEKGISRMPADVIPKLQVVYNLSESEVLMLFHKEVG